MAPSEIDISPPITVNADRMKMKETNANSNASTSIYQSILLFIYIYTPTARHESSLVGGVELDGGVATHEDDEGGGGEAVEVNLLSVPGEVMFRDVPEGGEESVLWGGATAWHGT